MTTAISSEKRVSVQKMMHGFHKDIKNISVFYIMSNISATETKQAQKKPKKICCACPETKVGDVYFALIILHVVLLF
jgi:hypothetical protein